MARIVRGGLIQATVTHAGTADPQEIAKAMTEKNMAMIEEAARQGVQVLCLQELFNGPYFCAEQTMRWYDMTEQIPDGPDDPVDVRDREAAGHGDGGADLRGGAAGVYYNTAAVIDADGTLSREVPQEPHSALCARILGEVLLSSPATWGIRCSRRQWARVGVYICYDRHFPEGARALGLQRGGDRVQSVRHGGRTQ